MDANCSGEFRASTPVATRAVLISVVLLLFTTGCTGPDAVVGILVEPLTPYVNELVHLTGSIAGGVSSDDILEWEWEFGDGLTARGRDVWHQYRFHREDEDGGVVPWVVQLTATDSSGRRYIGTKNVVMHDKRLTCLAGYYSRHATTQCTDEQGNRPEPAGQELTYTLDDVVVGWWDATSIPSFYLLAKLFYLPDTDEAVCTWRLYSRGDAKDGAPAFLSEMPPDTRSVSHGASYFYSVGFPLRVVTADVFPSPGWYQIIAEAESSDGQHRDFIDFMIYVGG
jgi:hypothetical protein